MIKRLVVKGLHGKFDFDLVFNEDLNILTGKNGSGKTTILKLLWYLISGNLHRITSEMRFDKAEIETDNFSLKMSIDRNFENDEIHLELKPHEESQIRNCPTKNSDNSNFIEYRSHDIACLSQPSIFFPTFRRIEGGFWASGPPEGDIIWRSGMDTLQDAMSDLSTKISTANHRFVASISTHDLVGLLTQADLVGRPFTVLSELVGKILNYSGIRFTENIALGDATNAIYSEQLSSGEKQMLSFLCHNAFQKNSIIFIDEPELSLHVDWQRLLFPMLLKQGTDNQFIVATHSPFIYSRYPDKEIILDSDRGGE